jgi:hypothetical protein
VKEEISEDSYSQDEIDDVDAATAMLFLKHGPHARIHSGNYLAPYLTYLQFIQFRCNLYIMIIEIKYLLGEVSQKHFFVESSTFLLSASQTLDLLSSVLYNISIRKSLKLSDTEPIYEFLSFT